MVRVFVREHHGIDLRWLSAEEREPPFHLAAGDAYIDQDPSSIVCDKYRIPTAPAAQNRNRQTVHPAARSFFTVINPSAFTRGGFPSSQVLFKYLGLLYLREEYTPSETLLWKRE
jgi:hypothetical protein